MEQKNVSLQSALVEVIDIATSGSCRTWKFYIEAFLIFSFIHLHLDPRPDFLSSVSISYSKIKCNSLELNYKAQSKTLEFEDTEHSYGNEVRNLKLFFAATR